ncbi:ferredoxin [Nonomuraea sp. NPDC050783]|uniref:ferredoxin n=1 Tax=Nonomuraea sp. NPDC050783 TaxID=3154634 RepID=UPI0034656659
MMRIKADTSLYVGSGQCVLTEPAVFDQDDDGVVALLSDHPDDRAEARARSPARPALVPSTGFGSTRWGGAGGYL